MNIYLSGPITGSDEADILSWRKRVKAAFGPEISFLDPAEMSYDSNVAYLRRETPNKALKRLRHGRFVVERSKTLIQRSDLLLACFLGTERVASIGSVGETFYADALGKPIVIVREKDGNVHDHSMLNAVAARVCHSLPEAVDCVGQILGTSPDLQAVI